MAKALVVAYTNICAKKYMGKIGFYSIEPGMVDTPMTKKMPSFLKKGIKTPDQGTVSIKHCLFNTSNDTQSGHFFGCDGKRSPIHEIRNEGTPEYTGGYEVTE